MKKYLLILFCLFSLIVNSQQLFTSYYTSGVVVPDTAWKPTDIDSCKLWLAADKGVTKDGGNYVSVWADQSGNGNNAVQETGINQPKWYADSLNHLPIIKFDGSNDFMISTFVKEYARPYTIFIVVRIKATTTSDILVIDGISNTKRLTVTTVGGNYYFNSIALGMSYTKSVPFPNYVITTGKFTTTASSLDSNVLYENSVFKARNIDHNATNITGFVIGSYYAHLSAYLNGNLAEIIMYRAKLNNTDRLTVENYLKTKYGL